MASYISALPLLNSQLESVLLFRGDDLASIIATNDEENLKKDTHILDRQFRILAMDAELRAASVNE